MNPNIDKVPFPKMNLPGSAAGDISVGEQQKIQPEVAEFQNNPTQSSPIPMSGPILPMTLPSGPSIGVDPLPIDSGLTPAPTNNGVTHDIEKEYVAKAKAIVSQTKADPYIQNKELNKVRAEFIKKQYGKEIKLSER